MDYITHRIWSIITNELTYLLIYLLRITNCPLVTVFNILGAYLYTCPPFLGGLEYKTVLVY